MDFATFRSLDFDFVMRGLDPRIHAFSLSCSKTWMAGSSPAMTLGVASVET
jgi:hypothetical protein